VAAATLKGDTPQQVERLIARMQFDPELAQHLLTREVKQVDTPAWNVRLQALIRRMEVGRELWAGEDEE